MVLLDTNKSPILCFSTLVATLSRVYVDEKFILCYGKHENLIKVV